MAGLLAAVLLFLVFGEGLARLTHLVDRLNGYGRDLYTAGPSRELPYRLRPGVSTLYLGTPVRVNGLGFRGPDVAPAPASGVRRILLVGDSVVFGQGVREEDTVAAVLERTLNADGTRRVEVINGGVPGYDTLAELRLVETAGLPLHPDTLVVGFSLNDFDPPPAYSPIGVLSHDGGATGISIVDRSEFITLLRWLWSYAHGTLGYQILERANENQQPGAGPALDLGALDRAIQAQHLRVYHDLASGGGARITPACAALAAFGRAHALPILVAIFPEQYQVGVAQPDVTPQQRLLEVCRQTGLRCLDLQPAFAAAGGALFSDLQHPNAAGHAVAAAAIADALRAP